MVRLEPHLWILNLWVNKPFIDYSASLGKQTLILKRYQQASLQTICSKQNGANGLLLTDKALDGQLSNFSNFEKAINLFRQRLLEKILYVRVWDHMHWFSKPGTFDYSSIYPLTIPCKEITKMLIQSPYSEYSISDSIFLISFKEEGKEKTEKRK